MNAKQFWHGLVMFMLGALWSVIVLAFLLPSECRAESVNPQWTVGVHVGSLHSNNRDNVAGRNWNNVNPGLFVRRDNVVVGTYYNSIRKESFYVGYVYSVTDWLDVTIGAVSGYAAPGYSAKPVMPLVVPSVHFDVMHNVAARIHLIPQVSKGGASAVHLSMEYRFN